MVPRSLHPLWRKMSAHSLLPALFACHRAERPLTSRIRTSAKYWRKQEKKKWYNGTAFQFADERYKLFRKCWAWLGKGRTVVKSLISGHPGVSLSANGGWGDIAIIFERLKLNTDVVTKPGLILIIDHSRQNYFNANLPKRITRKLSVSVYNKGPLTWSSTHSFH